MGKLHLGRVFRSVFVWSVFTLGACGTLAPPLPDIPKQYDHWFTGRIILEKENYTDMMKDSRCQGAWDGAKGNKVVYACSIHLPDELNPGKEFCHMIVIQPEAGVWSEQDMMNSIRIENANCNGWHDAEKALDTHSNSG